ncbi:Leucine-rich repeat receptor-like serine/threonine-protein kinase BAM1 [Bienertia sinuspersici]
MSLDFSKNNLSGRIPHEISKLSILSSLNLSRNHLIGELPTEILTYDMKILASKFVHNRDFQRAFKQHYP